MTRPTTVLFDLGGVLIRWNPRNLYRKIFDGDEAGMERFLSTICTPLWNLEQDQGRSLAEGTRVLVERHPEHRELIESYYGRWEEMLDGAIEENVALLRRIVDAGHPVYAITDWSAETFPIARRKFDFLGLFKGIVVSGEEGCLKPSARIFGVLDRRYGLAPADMTFIDDSRENVDGAAELGFDTVHYTDPEHLREAMSERGYLDVRAR
ncbi:MAG TPA: HAD family phosphatase [Glycomyces sp.]|nr:HAD family phosphatase [Glycomyces sp.]